MHWPHGHFHREGNQEGEENQNLRRHAQRILLEVGNQETAGLEIQVQQRHQHEHRTEKGVQKELERGIDPARSTPDADNQEHRDQHRFPEDIEQRRIQRREHADHQPFHEQERRHVLRHPILDHFPAGQHHQHGHETGQNDQRHGNAIDPEMVMNVELRNPVNRPLDELHRRRAAVEGRVQGNRKHEGQQGKQQRQPARHRLLRLTVCRQYRDSAENRGPDDKTQKWPISKH